MTLSLQHPFMAIVAGPTGCGKTRFVVRLVENVSKMIEPIPDKIMYCYSEFQSLFSQYPQVKFHESLPDVTKFDGQQRILLIIDDLMLFTNGSHHRNVSMLYLTQNLFHKNRYMRTISLNSHYMVLFKNPRDAGQFSILARQMYPYPSRFKFVEEAY